MIEQDYIMRLIKELVRTVLKLVFNIDIEKVEKMDQVEFESLEDTLYYKKLLDMVDRGMINEAENMLLDNLDISNQKNFQMGLMFYYYLNNKDDDFLEECNFTRSEVHEGIQYICKQYGYSGFADLFLDKY